MGRESEVFQSVDRFSVAEAGVNLRQTAELHFYFAAVVDVFLDGIPLEIDGGQLFRVA